MPVICRPLLLLLLSGLCHLATADTWVSIRPLALIHQALLPDAPAPGVILPAGQNLHDYALSVSDLRHLQQASLLLWLGDHNEGFIARLAAQQPRPHWHALAPDSDHAWLDPARLPALIDVMAGVLAQQQPQQATAIAARQAALLASLENWQQQWQASLAPHRDTAFLLGHDAFLPMTRQLGLNGALLYRSGHSHGHRQDGTRSLLVIQQQLADGTIRCALEEPDISFAALAKRYPRLQRRQLKPMADNADSFISFLHHSAATLADCLQGD